MPTTSERREYASPVAHYAHEKACLADAVSFSQTLKPPKFPPRATPGSMSGKPSCRRAELGDLQCTGKSMLPASQMREREEGLIYPEETPARALYCKLLFGFKCGVQKSLTVPGGCRVVVGAAPPSAALHPRRGRCPLPAGRRLHLPALGARAYRTGLP